MRLVLEHSVELGGELEVGASLAVAGVCLTLVEAEAGRCTVEVSPETLARTTLGGLRAGSAINLEPSLRAGDPLGGHWVQGHVDATLGVLHRRDLTDHRVVGLELPAEHAPFLVFKGSVALDGVSLTVSARESDHFEVALIPHTLEVTTLGDLQPGDRVNLEVDILAKYVYQAVAAMTGAD